MGVIAVAVQSGINDKGIEKIKNDFSSSQKANKVEVVDGLGEAAFYMSITGQVHVRDDHHWYIFSRSTGDEATSVPKDQVIEFAKKLLEKDKGTV